MFLVCLLESVPVWINIVKSGARCTIHEESAIAIVSVVLRTYRTCSTTVLYSQQTARIINKSFMSICADCK